MTPRALLKAMMDSALAERVCRVNVMTSVTTFGTLECRQTGRGGEVRYTWVFDGRLIRVREASALVKKHLESLDDRTGYLKRQLVHLQAQRMDFRLHINRAWNPYYQLVLRESLELSRRIRKELKDAQDR